MKMTKSEAWAHFAAAAMRVQLADRGVPMHIVDPTERSRVSKAIVKESLDIITTWADLMTGEWEKRHGNSEPPRTAESRL